ncbi:hypothetical protein [Pelagibius sp.]|uniref:hypothetical protein n=1 Tax=Pelagibius sp. TaxID=1931238 RepID=UPI002613733C|nr:hypothetical protein [Pelagibius sp.]
MKLKNISLTQLSVNSANDRHGELADEHAAIEWLLTHRAAHMRNLTKDIVAEGRVYEPPLVHEDGMRYVVYDGNRRTTCLKLLAEPQKAPSTEWADYFAARRTEWKGKFPDRVQCHVESDRDTLDEILYRRHTGQQSGVGQSQWDAAAKSNFVRRTGKKTRVNLAEEIELRLRDAGHIATGIPRSNMNRLLSAEAFRNRVGISIVNNRVEYTHETGKVTAALARIANDLVLKRVVLEDIWNNKGKRAYLDKLEKDGVLPTAVDALPQNKDFKKTKPIPKPPEKDTPAPSVPAPEARTTLIRNIDYGLVPQAHTQRATDIWKELQFRLKFGDHDNAIAVLFRVLLEFSVENYISRRKLTTVHVNDKLSKKFHKVLDDMLIANTLEKKYLNGLKKFEQTEPLVSANTLNAYVHHKDFFPSDHHLKSMWDTLSGFIVACIKA